ncbi:MAG: purine-binding chemotaxis protein CheW [Lachnospiraceae bacterium]|nr:purine-binding chemotaxis protein CheW [Lachnospiraceae bacterium]
MEELKFVIFQLEDQKYGMNLSHINGIEQGYSIIPVPNAPEGIKGIINLRGVVIPVYSLREHFGMPTRITNPEKSLLVTKSSGTMLAYEVDAVIAIEQMKKKNINDMPEVASNENTIFMQHVLHIGSEIVIEIDADKVLSEETRARVNKMIAENGKKDA